MIWSPVNFSKYRPEIDQYLVSKEKKVLCSAKKGFVTLHSDLDG